MIYLQLAWEFFKVGLFAVGGGLATVPFLYDMAEKYPWFTAAQLTDMIAVSESTPGPIGINMATYVGYTVGSGSMGVFGGILGALTATLSIVLPSVVVIIVIASLLERFKDNTLVKATFLGLRPAVAALVTLAAISVIKLTLINIEAFTASGVFWRLFNPLPIAIFAVCLFCMLRFKKVAPQWYLLGGAALGILLGL